MQLLLDIEELFQVIESLDDPDAEKQAKETIGLRDEDSVKCANIGPGADWLVILTTISTVGLAILKGPTVIRDGLRDWKWLIDKIKGYINKQQLVSVDEEGAFYLAVNYLAEKFGEDASFRLIDSHTFNIVDLSGMIINREKSLADHPHNYYVFVFNIAYRNIVLSVRSTGEIRQLESFDDMPYGLSD